ncbi:MAG: ParB/RepB/Spo0J family partition protein [Lachnospiraceae bacterium]
MDKENSDAIVNISTREIYQHPGNPRKDLGELSELADSIKKNGIMQNLTVIPGHWLTDEEWLTACERYKKDPSEDLRLLMNERWTPEGYTLIIGHRRFAASKMAGITTLPCRIIDGMDKKDQVSTMLAENMQRADLTILEQANGFQMMLDLGETEEQIAEKSGFSRKTVRHRLNIAKLDQKILKEKEADDSFQLSLKDLYELEKVEDIAVRNKILGAARNSKDLIWRAQDAVNEAVQDKNAATIIQMLKDAGVKEAPKKAKEEIYTSKWESIREYSLSDDPPKRLTLPKKERDKLSYFRYYSSIRVVKKASKKKEAETPQEKARKETDRKKKQIKDIMKEMDKRKHEMVSNIISGKIPQVKEVQEVRDEMWGTMIDLGTSLYMSSLSRFFTQKESYNCTTEEREEAISRFRALSPAFQMLVAMSDELEHAGDPFTYSLNYHAENCGKIKKAYAVLERYGWTYTEEEKQILDGTHEFYVPEEKEEKE